MKSITEGNHIVSLDDEGFMLDSSTWDEKLAKQLAEKEGYDHLDQEQMAIIRILRTHFDRHGSFPILASICKKAGSKRRDCVARKFHNPMLAWKIAGLPKPSNIFFVSFDDRRYIPNPFYRIF